MSSPVALLGASGYTGRLIAQELARLGVPFVAAGRDPGKVEAAVAGTSPLAIRPADVDDPGSLDALLAEAPTLITTVGPFTERGRPAVDAAIRGGARYIDTTGEQPFVADVFARHADAVAAGALLVPAAGHDFVPGDALAPVAAGALGEVEACDVHVAYLVDGGRGPLPPSSAGTRASIAAMVGRPMLALVRGELLEETLAETRRLAWFPRPVGPSHAAGFPGAEPLTVPRHVPAARTVRTYLAVRSWQAEALQAVSNLARLDAVARMARRLIAARDGDPTPEQRAGVRWACVAEAADDDGNVARAWAYGHDVYALTATSASLLAAAMAGGAGEPGTRAPCEVVEATALLDDLAANTDLRWSVKRPT